MKRDCRNIYQIAREDAGLTQEQAASLLVVSVRALGEYETGARVPKGDIVNQMIDVYKTKWLWYMHLKNNDPVGSRFLPSISFDALPTMVLKLQKEIKDVMNVNDDIVSVACDGKIEPHENESWKRIKNEISELMGACVAVTMI